MNKLFNSDAVKVVDAIYDMYGNTCIETILKEFNIKIIERTDWKYKKGKILGDTIHINANLQDEVKKFVIAHEVGHFLLDYDRTIFYNFSTSASHSEMRVNDFALLMISREYEIDPILLKLRLNEWHKLNL